MFYISCKVFCLWLKRKWQFHMIFFVLLAFGFVFYAEIFPIDMVTIKLSLCQYPEMVLFLTWKKAVFMYVMLRAVSWPHQLFCWLTLILPLLRNCNCCCCSTAHSDLCASQKLLNKAWAALHVVACVILS